MESLRQQIDPYLTAVPDPNQTFQQYIQQLLATAPTNAGFSSAFTGAGQQATQPQQQAPQTPTTPITSGMFADILDRSAERSGGGSSSRSTADRDTTGQGIQGISAQNVYGAMIDNPSLISSGVNNALGLLGIQNPLAPVMSLAVKGLGELGFASERDAIGRSFDAMNAINNLGVPGIGTISDAAGNIRSVSNQAMIDAADRAMFGVTGAELAASVTPAAETVTAPALNPAPPASAPDIRSILGGLFSGLGSSSPGGVIGGSGLSMGSYGGGRGSSSPNRGITGSTGNAAGAGSATA